MYSVKNDRIMTCNYQRGVKYITVKGGKSTKSFRVHMLVAELFILNRNNYKYVVFY